MNGPIGLDYTALPVVFKFRGIGPETEIDVFEGVQIMEVAALKSIRENRGR